LYLDKLVNDLVKLSEGESVIINTKNEKLNPEYKKTEKRIPAEFFPKPIMLVEGFLVLFDERIRKMLSTSFWFEVDHRTRSARRVHFKTKGYEEKVLIPMHKKYVELTRKYAKHIIDVSGLAREQVLKKVEGVIFSRPRLVK